LSKEVSAFANAEGGVIIIGIAEKREGKARVASQIDDGVDILEWNPERLQQLIESNVSPYLTGIRIKTVFLNNERTRAAYVISVPQGTTAYQASDRRYYGRSEYESKALPDHEIRLRMFRGKVANAVIHIHKYQVEAEWFTGHRRFVLAGQQKINRDAPPDRYRCKFSISLKNVGKINITEFKVCINFSDQCSLQNFEESYKDSWTTPGNLLMDSQLSQEFMKINVYPEDTFHIEEKSFTINNLQELVEKKLELHWKLYLNNTSPIEGRIDIGAALNDIARSSFTEEKAG
jgi:hypothetical protein